MRSVIVELQRKRRKIKDSSRVVGYYSHRKHKPYKVKKTDVIGCEILAVVTDKHHGTQVMMKTDNDGTFFVDLNETFHLFKEKKPEEYAHAPYDWSEFKFRNPKRSIA